ncbi:SMODS domain-containing nucleotidyltransferase [Haloarcula amylovorans]|uniref:SMODS domain-containing nucleotidyltransferase n=1 Tax=Haloarcula amylovorans TaxID=2562280 RepID=UPI001076A5BB|nr:hypothetical protein [Halomicroarcula amylolytica]
MASIPTLFAEFLSNIRPKDNHIEDYKSGHRRLREKLQDDDSVSEFYVADFLQGSYKRSTAVKPRGDEKSDVDIVFVSNIERETNPDEALELCVPFLQKHYDDDEWKRNDRSFKIERDSVEIDLVLTATPTEAARSAVESMGAFEVEENLGIENKSVLSEALGMNAKGGGGQWKDEPLYIPDRRLQKWEKTHPLKTLEFTSKKNSLTDGHYVNVVKALKWWRRCKTPDVEGPSSYPLEHLVGECCPNSLDSVAQGVTSTLEQIRDEYRSHAAQNRSPELPAHGLPNVDVFDRIDGDEFAEFHSCVVDAADIARTAYGEDNKSQSRDEWVRLFGDEFPPYEGSDSDNEDGKAVSFSSSESTEVSDQEFAWSN